MARADRSRDERSAPASVSVRRIDRKGVGRRRPPSPTVLLLVRHGTTTTTGRELPGRAPGLHLSDTGRQQAERVAVRIAELAGVRGDDDPVLDGDDPAAPQGGAAGTQADGPTDVPTGGPDRPGGAGEPGGAPGEGSDADRADGDGDGRRGSLRAGGVLGRARRKPDPGPRVTAVYASPLERTRETAAPIARLLGHEVVVDDGLLELDVGDWTGLELKAARKRKEWAAIQRYPSGFTFPGGESFVAMQARMTATLDRLRAAHPGQTVVAVSHADPIRAAVAHAMGTHLDLFQRVVVSPCSVTAIAYSDEGPTVLTVNDTGATGALVPS